VNDSIQDLFLYLWLLFRKFVCTFGDFYSFSYVLLPKTPKPQNPAQIVKNLNFDNQIIMTSLQLINAQADVVRKAAALGININAAKGL